MIKSIKLYNCYGIKKLEWNGGFLKKNNIVFAPNGVMKTSFAETFQCFKKGEYPKDELIDGLTTTFEIEDDNGAKFNENTPVTDLCKIKSVIFANNYFDNINFDKNLFKYALSDKLRVKKNSNDLLKNKYTLELNFIAKNAVGISNDKYDNSFLRRVTSSEMDAALLEKMENSYSKKFSDLTVHLCNKYKFNELFDEKIEKIITAPDLLEKWNEYKKLYDDEIEKLEIFKKTGFNIEKFESVIKHAEKEKYFAANHKLKIFGDSDEYDLEKSNNKINDLKEQIFSSNPKIKSIYDDAKKIFTNKETKEFGKKLDEDSNLMKLLADYKNNKQDFILYNLTKKTSKNEIIDLKQNVLSFYKCIEEISKEAKSEIQEWEEIIKQYRTKFFCDTIDFEIDSSNTEDSVMIPKFKFYIKHSNKPLDDATKKRLSSGEKKVLLILNILFEVEISKKMNKPFIVILDDIVESFDYKNKYAVLNYIREISDNDLVQIFIFTHNFDFYRDCQRLMDTSLSSHMFADKILNSDGTVKEIKFEEISNKYKDYKFLQDWKSNTDKPEIHFAILPFARNIFQIDKGGKSNEYKSSCDYMHYDYSRTKNLTSESFINLLNNWQSINFIIPSSINKNDSYYKYLNWTVKELLKNKSNQNEFSLEAKIVYSLFLRIACEQLVFTKHKNEYIDKFSNISVNDAIKKNSSSFSTEEMKFINEVDTFSPSFIHLNSFAIETLIQVGIKNILLEVETALNDLNINIEK